MWRAIQLAVEFPSSVDVDDSLKESGFGGSEAREEDRNPGL